MSSLEFDDNGGPAHLGEMVFKGVGGVHDDHGDHGDAAFFRYLKAALMKGEEGVIYLIASALRENAQGDSVFDFFHALEDGL